MYKRHNIWEEDKWDIHSSGSSYSGHSSGKSEQDYHKSETYNAKSEESRSNDDYRAMERQEEDREKKENERTIVDPVEREQKYQKNEEGEFQAVAKEIQQGSQQEDMDNKTKEVKKKHNRSIEEAIKEAIKGEKEIVHVD